jgi:hypothetical protein
MAAKTEKQLQQEELNFKQQLDAMPKVPIMIPVDPLNKGDVVPIGCNGVVYAIPRGKQFMVPELIAQIYFEAYEKTQAANDKMTISENRDIVVTG